MMPVRMSSNSCTLTSSVANTQSTGTGPGGGWHGEPLPPPLTEAISVAVLMRQKYDSRSFMSPVMKTGSPVSLRSLVTKSICTLVAATRHRAAGPNLSAGLWKLATQNCRPVFGSLNPTTGICLIRPPK